MNHLDRYEIALRARGENTDTALIVLRRLQRDGLPIPFTKDEALAAISELRERMAPNSERRYVSVIKAFSRWYAEEYDADDVARNIKRPKGTVPAPGRIANMAEIEAVIDSLVAKARRSPEMRFTHVRAAAVLRVLADTGCRRSELIRLKLDDLLFEQQQPEILFRVPKNRHERRVPMTDAVEHLLTRWYLPSRDQQGAASSPALFIGTKGALTTSGVESIVRKLEREYGARIKCHDLRRSLAHRLAAAGVADDSIMSVGGWKSPIMPIYYRRELAGERARDDFLRVFNPG